MRFMTVFISELFAFIRRKIMLKTELSAYFDNMSSPLIADIDKCMQSAC